MVKPSEKNSGRSGPAKSTRKSSKQVKPIKSTASHSEKRSSDKHPPHPPRPAHRPHLNGKAPAEAKKLFAQIKERTPASSQVSGRIKQLEKTYE